MVALEKDTYGRHDKKGIEKFREHVEKMLEDLLAWPQIAGLRSEPFPPKTAENVEGWTLHKLEFSCPRANGSQRQGRLMILVNLAERLIRPIYIYTHAQFPGRVPDGSLKDVVLKAARSSPQTPVHASPETTPAAPAAPGTAAVDPDEK
jgi:hypothetical protein